MGNSASRALSCFLPKPEQDGGMATLFTDPLEEGLGHSFCYIRPVVVDEELGDSTRESEEDSYNPTTTTTAENHPHQLRSHLQREPEQPPPKSISETSFKSISGASVSANTSAPRSIVYDPFTTTTNTTTTGCCDRSSTFESTPSFSALPLQPIPRGISLSGPLDRGFSSSGPLPADRSFLSGPLERGFMSGPIERGVMSGPLDRGYYYNSGPFDPFERNFSGPVFGAPVSSYLRKRRKSLARVVRTVGGPVKKALTRTVSSLTRSNRSVVAPMKSFATSKVQASNNKGNNKGGNNNNINNNNNNNNNVEGSRRDLRSYLDSPQSNGEYSDVDGMESHNLHWAQGKAGEDRVHVVLSEEHGWLFVGIYDGFSGPDATDFLMTSLYPAIYKELKGLLWDQKRAFELPPRYVTHRSSSAVHRTTLQEELQQRRQEDNSETGNFRGQAKVADFDAEVRRHNGSVNRVDVSVVELDYSQRFACEEGDGCGGLCQRNEGERSEAPDARTSAKSINMRSLSTRFRKVYNRRKRVNQGRIYQCRYDWEQERMNAEMKREEQKQKVYGRGPVNHAGVLKALARALEATEESYLDMIDDMFDENPELALMGSCVLVMLMKDEDVYIMNVGDSRAVLAQQRKAVSLDNLRQRPGSQELQELERIIEETPMDLAAFEAHNHPEDTGPPAVSSTLGALQLSMDHSTKVLEEAVRIKLAHPDDTRAILNDRVKGKLAVTRAFGAGYLKQPKWNDALLEVFRIEFVGSAPYITCIPHLRHHRLCPQDQFLVLSSDGLYQYLTNEEVVSHVEWFLEKFPDGDPAQYLIEVVLFRAAKKAGMEFHDLLDIPQGDRRKYHDDLSVMVVSLEGRIWRSSSQESHL